MALLDRLDQALTSLEVAAGRLVPLFVDLDDFKSVNDTLGHDTGDRVLSEASRSLASELRRAIDNSDLFVDYQPLYSLTGVPQMWST